MNACLSTYYFYLFHLNYCASQLYQQFSLKLVYPLHRLSQPLPLLENCPPTTHSCQSSPNYTSKLASFTHNPIIVATTAPHIDELHRAAPITTAPAPTKCKLQQQQSRAKCKRRTFRIRVMYVLASCNFQLKQHNPHVPRYHFTLRWCNAIHSVLRAESSLPPRHAVLVSTRM